VPLSPDPSAGAGQDGTGPPPSPSDTVTAADLAASPGLVVELQAARAWGVPPSVFWGEQRHSVTQYRHDATGRLVETVTAHEPLWRDEDRALAFALAEYEAGLCDGHGGPLAEGMDPAHEFAFRGEIVGRCHACTAQSAAAAAYEAAPNAHALRFRVRLDPKAAAAGRERVARQRAQEEVSASADSGGADGAGAAGGGEQGPATGSRQGVAAGADRGPDAGGEADDGGRAAEL
jgi:hypothetical protein